MTSPFRVGGPVTGEFFTNRSREVNEILEGMRHPTRMLIRGPRRQGKTSALAQAGRRFREGGGILLWADLSTMATLSDLRDRLLTSLPGGFFGAFEGLQELLPVLEVVLADPTLGTQTYRFRAGEPRRQEPGVREQIRLLLQSIARRRETLGRPVAVVLDEVQAVARMAEERVDWFLRDLMQGAPEISFLCAGSQPSLLEAMASEKDAAFFRFFTPGPRFDAMDRDHLATWIAHRLSGAGVACTVAQALAITRIGDRTQDVILYADTVFACGKPSGRVDARVLEEALDALLRKEHERYLRLWEMLTANQRVGLRAIAMGVESLYAHESGLPIPASSLHRVVGSLRSRGILADGARVAEIDDPFFREWILRYAMPDSVPEGIL